MTKNKWISDLHWVRPGQQTRSQKTQEALLDAAEALFAERGADATSVADVAKRAGCSVGAVYHHFRDKKALVYAIFDRMAERYSATTKEATNPVRWEGATILDILEGYMQFALESGRERPSFKQAGLEATRGEPILQQRLMELKAEADSAMSKLLIARIGEIGHPDPVLAIGFALSQATAMLKIRLEEPTPAAQLTAYSDDEFIREALRSFAAYLQIRTPASVAHEQ